MCVCVCVCVVCGVRCDGQSGGPTGDTGKDQENKLLIKTGEIMHHSGPPWEVPVCSGGRRMGSRESMGPGLC